MSVTAPPTVTTDFSDYPHPSVEDRAGLLRRRDDRRGKAIDVLVDEIGRRNISKVREKDEANEKLSDYQGRIKVIFGIVAVLAALVAVVGAVALAIIAAEVVLVTAITKATITSLLAATSAGAGVFYPVITLMDVLKKGGKETSPKDELFERVARARALAEARLEYAKSSDCDRERRETIERQYQVVADLVEDIREAFPLDAQKNAVLAPM